MKVSIRNVEICGDYALDIEYSDKTSHTLYFNSKRNADTVKKIIEIDSSVPNEATVADVVEVVRCKDCKYYQDNNGGYPHEMCKWRENETPDPDDYCSCGERKER